MKIIGKTISGFILDADNDEIALLMGFRNTYDEGMKSIKLNIGAEMDLRKMAATSEFLRTVDKDKLNRLKEQLSDAINDIENAQEAIQAIQAITLFETIKNK